MEEKSVRPKTVALIGTCSNCGESVEVMVSKKQVKALMKAFKASTPQEANRLAEAILGRNKKGSLRF